MASLMHCFWTGPSFPYGLRCFIKKWAHYFRKSKSEFQLVVWLTDDSMSETEKFLSTGLGNKFNSNIGRYFPGLEVGFHKASMGFNSFYIWKFDTLLREYHPIINETVMMLKSHSYYTSVSNIARLMIVNKCGGIYTDIDFLMPKEERPFPPKINNITGRLRGVSAIGLFLPVNKVKTDGGNVSVMIENQCVLLDPHSRGRLDPLFAKMAAFFDKNFQAIKHDCINNQEYVSHEITRHLGKSLYMEQNDLSLLSAYKARDYDEFCHITSEMYQGVNHAGIRINSSGNVKDKPSMLDRAGTRHESYRMISQATYTIVVEFFMRNLSCPPEQYFLTHWKKFEAFFDSKSVGDQFQFVDRRGATHGMYSWANPGYSRLTSLEKAARVIGARQHERTMLSAQLIAHLLRLARLSIKEINDERIIRLQNILAGAEHSGFVNRNVATCILKELFYSIFCCKSEKEQMVVGVMVNMVNMINRSNYEKVRKLIDPEKSEIDYQDLVGFCYI
ncbi:glycosyltransferase [Lentisphaerota bacterium WC36G]|nr:hypothetical protein LJT99_03985 [Lentisphaerae bacterium WC36]